MEYPFRNVLIIGAHYDDTELAAGGLAARLSKNGSNIYKITLTNTEVIDFNFGLNIKGDDAKNDSKTASKILGVEEIEFEQRQYGTLSYEKQLMQKLEKIIMDYNIDTCIFHFKNDYQTDHIAAHQICSTAARHCRNLLMFQSNPYILSESFYPNFFIDVSDYITQKKEALCCYDKAHNRKGNLFEATIDRNRLWGYSCGVEYAEAFVAIKLSF